MLKKEIYVWQVPVRIYHWVNVLLIVALLITGFYIGKPYLVSVNEPYNNFFMGRMRLWHFVAAWLFIANFIFRFYWAFAGNEYAKFNLYRKDTLRDALETIKYYLFLTKEHRPHYGHNVIAKITYLFFIWIGSIFMIATGLAMQGETVPGGFQARVMGWLIPLFGSSSSVRSYHHLVAWFFVIFIVTHLYLTLRQDLLDHDATLSSICSGYKFARPEDDAESNQR